MDKKVIVKLESVYKKFGKKTIVKNVNLLCQFKNYSYICGVKEQP